LGLVILVKKRKNKKIQVRAPDYIPKKAHIFKDTTGTEALDVFKIADAAGRILSFIMFAVGIFFLGLITYSGLTTSNVFFNPLFYGFLGLAGISNIFCGMLLLAKK
jgi:hypothetical protein